MKSTSSCHKMDIHSSANVRITDTRSMLSRSISLRSTRKNVTRQAKVLLAKESVPSGELLKQVQAFVSRCQKW